MATSAAALRTQPARPQIRAAAIATRVASIEPNPPALGEALSEMMPTSTSTNSRRYAFRVYDGANPSHRLIFSAISDASGVQLSPCFRQTRKASRAQALTQHSRYLPVPGCRFTSGKTDRQRHQAILTSTLDIANCSSTPSRQGTHIPLDIIQTFQLNTSKGRILGCINW